jgi:hypothetical protein
MQEIYSPIWFYREATSFKVNCLNKFKSQNHNMQQNNVGTT